MQLSHHLAAVVTIGPEDPAVEHDGRMYLWADLRRVDEAVDHALSSIGVSREGRVAFLARNRPVHYATLLSLLRTERTIVIMNPDLGTERLVDDLKGQRVQAVISSGADFADPLVRRAALQSSLALVELGFDLGDPVTLHLGEAAPDECVVTPGVAVEMLTSGTTGAPKRVPLTYRTLERSLENILQHHFASTAVIARHSRRASVLHSPPVHMSGFYASLRTLVEGRIAVLLDRFEVDSWADAVRRHRPVVASLVPAAIRMVLDSDVEPEALSSLKILTSGAAPLPAEVGQAFEARYGVPVLSSYGATEFAGAVVGWSLTDHHRWGATKAGSVGRPHPGTEVRVVSLDDGSELEAGQVGLLAVRSDQLSQAGWVTTSDLAAVDEDGFVWIKGRADGAINRGGFKVLPAEITAALERHPAVREAAVIGIVDDRLGQIPVAAVELKDAADAVSGAELREYARAHLTPYQTPARVLVLPSLPRTTSMKVCEADLRALFDAAEDTTEVAK